MPPELYDFLKSIFSALVGAGMTFAVVAKFGQSWFFKKLDAKYAIDLAQRNNELKGDLERKKNDLNKELQIEITRFKSQLEVLGSQQSKFLEKKVNSVLILNQHHYIAVKNIKEYTDTTYSCVDEATSYFKYQFKEGEADNLSSYDVYRKIHQERWPSYEKAAKSAFDKYVECLALNMPILPKELVEEDIEIVDKCREILADASMTFNRAMNFTQYIVQPEECEGTADEFMNDLLEELQKAAKYKDFLATLSSRLLEKSLRSGYLIERLLQHPSNS